MFSHDDELRIAQPWSHIHRGKSVWLEGTYSVDRQSLPDRAANAICCDRQSVSEHPATTVHESPILCVILLSIDAICSFSPCRGNARGLCVVWQRIFCPRVFSLVFSKSLWNFSSRCGGSALYLEQSGVASRRLFRQQRPPLRRQPRQSVLLYCQPRLRRQHQRSVLE